MFYCLLSTESRRMMQTQVKIASDRPNISALKAGNVVEIVFHHCQGNLGR